jgi:hypothetical protein
MLRIPLSLDSQLTGGSKVVSLIHHLFSTPQGLVWLEGLGKFKKINSPYWVLKPLSYFFCKTCLLVCSLYFSIIYLISLLLHWILHVAKVEFEVKYVTGIKVSLPVLIYR